MQQCIISVAQLLLIDGSCVGRPCSMSRGGAVWEHHCVDLSGFIERWAVSGAGMSPCICHMM